VAARPRPAAPARAPLSGASRRPVAQPSRIPSLTAVGVVLLVLGLAVAVVLLAGIIRLLVAP
jgi:hypothetical protein